MTKAAEMVDILIRMSSRSSAGRGPVAEVMSDQYRRKAYEALHAATDAGLISEGHRYALSMVLISKDMARARSA